MRPVPNGRRTPGLDMVVHVVYPTPPLSAGDGGCASKVALSCRSLVEHCIRQRNLQSILVMVTGELSQCGRTWFLRRAWTRSPALSPSRPQLRDALPLADGDAYIASQVCALSMDILKEVHMPTCFPSIPRQPHPVSVLGRLFLELPILVIPCYKALHHPPRCCDTPPLPLTPTTLGQLLLPSIRLGRDSHLMLAYRHC